MLKFIDQDKLALLLESLEQRFGHKPQAPREFEKLSSLIHNITGESVSASTLKRLWGYDKNRCSPYRYTLDILARYVGYDGVQDFFDKMALVPQANSLTSQNIDTSLTSPESSESSPNHNFAQGKNITHNPAARGRVQRGIFNDGALRYKNCRAILLLTILRARSSPCVLANFI